MTLLNITPGTPVRYKLTYADAVEGKWRDGTFAGRCFGGDDYFDDYLPKVSVTGPDHTHALFADRVQVQDDAGKWVDIWSPDADTDSGDGWRKVTFSQPVGEFYNTPCTSCGAGIPRTGRRGRPPTKCEECRK